MKKIILFALASLFLFSVEINARDFSLDKGHQRKSTKQKKFKPKKAVKKKVPYKHKDPAYK